MSAKIHSKCASQPEIANNSLKTYFGGSRSFKVIDLGTPGKLVSSAVMIRSKSVSIRNRSHARRANSAIVVI